MKSISNQILAYTLISLSVVFVGLFYFHLDYRIQFETDRLEKINVHTCERLAHFVANPKLNQDNNLLEKNVNIEALDENISSLQVLNPNNQLYSGVVRINDEVRPISGNRRLVLHQDSIVKPVMNQGKIIGKVVLYPNKEPLRKFIGELKRVLLLELSGAFLAIAIMLFFVLKKVVINPISSLKVWVSSINTDKSIPDPKILHSIEMDTIIDSVLQLTNRFVATLKESSDKSNQISEKEKLIRNISANLPDGMIYRIVIDNKGGRKFTYLSDAVEKKYGISAEEGINDGSLIFSRLLAEDERRFMETETEALKNLSIFRCEVRIINPDGTIRFSKFVSKPVILEDGTVCWDGIELDITNLKKAQADLQKNQFLLQSIADGLPDNIFAKDLDGNYLFVNSALAKRANKRPEELLGKNSASVYLSDDANKTWETDLEIMKSGKTQTFEELLNTESGSIFYLTTKGPFKNAHGETIGLFGIARDITERKKAEEALRVSQEKFAFAFNSSPNAIIIQDEQTGKYLEANESNAKVFGYSFEEFSGKTPLELNLYKDPTIREKIYEALNGEGYIRDMEILCRNKSGEDLHIILAVERHYVDNKPFLYVTVQDVTERKQVELELQKLNLDKDRFISILGHDLRGPVNSTIGLLDILNIDIDDLKIEEIKEIIDMVYLSAKNTSILLEDVLSWATAESGKMKFDPQITNFKVDCLGIIELLQFNADAKNIAIELHCEDLLEVYADKDMLGTVLRNLISNALKFTREGGKITILGEKGSKEIIVSIADNGMGIAPENIDKIFDKTQLFTSIGTNKEKGTGFGLKLCQEFVEKHDGKIWVESELGKGTTFYFSFPDAI